MKTIIAIAMAAFMAVSAACAQNINISDLKAKMPTDPKVKIGQLKNGIKYYIRENKKPENRAELQIVVKAGSVDEDNDQKGLAHFIEHMCFNGTKNFPKNDLVKFLESTGVRFGAELNANTNFDRTYYMVTIPLDKPGLMEKGVQVLEDWAHNVSFDPEELEKERGVIMSEWRVYRGAQDRVMKVHYPNIFHNSHYAERDVIGDTAVIQHAPRETFLRFYNDWYRPDNIAVIAVGDFKQDDIEKLIIKHFSKIENPKNPRQRAEYPVPFHKEPIVSIATDKELQYPSFSLYFKHPVREKGTYEDYRQGIVENLFETILNERYAELSRKPNPPFMIARGGVGGFVRTINLFTLFSVPTMQNVNNGLESLLTEAFRAMQSGFNASELDRAKTNLMRGMEQSLAEAEKTQSKAYAGEYYRNFTTDEGMPGVNYEVELYKKFLPSITLDEVNKLAGKLISKENLVITASFPEKEGIKAPAKDEILAIYDKVAGSKLEKYTDVATDKPLMAKKPVPGKIVETKVNKELNITEFKLSNGAKAILKPTDFKNDEVLFRAYSFGGSSLVSDNDALLAIYSAPIIDEGGIADFNATTLEKMMAGKIAGVSPSVSYLTEGFNGSASPKDIETMFQLLNLYFTQPRADKESFESFKTKMIEQIRNSKRSPESALSDTLNAVLGNYNKRNMPTEESDISNFDLQKAYSLYKERFADGGDFTYIFVGNFKIDDMKPLIETYIASLPTSGKKEQFKDLGIRPPKGHVEKEIKKGIEDKSSVRLVMTGDYEFSRQNNLVVKLLSDILSIRLREVIREDKGGVYGIGAYIRTEKLPYPNYATNIMFTTAPKRVDELLGSVNDVIKEIKAGKFEDEYLNKVKNMAKREYETQSKENRYWIGQIYTNEYYGMNINDVLSTVKRIDGVTKKEIVAAAKKYLDNTNMIKAVLNPEK